MPSREYQRSLGYYLDLAITEPAEFTKHGSHHVVVLSAREYQRLKRLDRQALFAWEVPKDGKRPVSSTLRGGGDWC